MKKITLLLVVAFLFAGFNADAQKKSKSSGKAKAEAERIIKEEQAKKAAEETENDRLMAEAAETARRDRMKIEKDSIERETAAEFTKDSLRAEKHRMNKEREENERLSQEKKHKINKNRDDINAAAGLNEYQGQQVKSINEQYHARAKAIKEDAAMSEDEKKTKLYALNKERVGKIKGIVGKKKAEALEKSRKEITDQNDDESNWVNEAGGKKTKKEKKSKKS